MTVALANSFENTALANGTTLTTANSAFTGSDGYDEVYGTWTINTTSTFRVPLGTRSAKLAVAAEAAGAPKRAWLSWSTSLGTTSDVTRTTTLYVPTSTIPFVVAEFYTALGLRCAALLYWQEALHLIDAKNAIGASTTMTVPTNHLSRFSFRCSIDATTKASNVLSVTLYNDHISPTQTETISASSAFLGKQGGTIAETRVGVCTPVGTAVSFYADFDSTTAATPGGNNDWAFSMSEPSGGGGINCLTLDPNRTGTSARLFAALDVGGITRSDDAAATWQSKNRGLYGEDAAKVAGIGAFPRPGANAQTLVVACTGGGVALSTDGGDNWSLTTSPSDFSSQPNSDNQPEPHSSGNECKNRSVGHLAAVDYVANGADGHIYVGTYHSGVYRSSNGGTSFSRIGMDQAYVRAIHLDPADFGKLYVGIYATPNEPSWPGGLYVFDTNLRTGTGLTPTRIDGGAFTVVEDIWFVGTRMYVAAGPFGVYSAVSPYTSWSSDNGDLPVASGTITRAVPRPSYQAGAGRDNGGAHVTVAVAGTPYSISGRLGKSHMRTANARAGSPVWAHVSDRSTFDATFIGTSETQWEFASAAGDDDMFSFGGHNGQGTSVVYDSASGYWYASDGQLITRSTDDGVTWRAACKGVSADSESAVTLDPTRPLRVLLSTRDHDMQISADGGDTCARTAISGGTRYTHGTTGYAHAVSYTDRYYVCHATNEGGTGDLYRSASPPSLSADGSLGLTYMGPTNYLMPMAVGVGRNGAGNERVIVCQDNGGGIRYTDNPTANPPTWNVATNPDGLFSHTSNARTVNGRYNVVWPAPNATNTALRQMVYDHDRYKVGRSSNYGATWGSILTKDSSGSYRRGFLAAAWDRSTAATNADIDNLYLSTDDGLYRIRSASGTPAVVTLSVTDGTNTWTQFGPITFDEDGVLYIVTIPTATKPGTVLKATSPSAVPTSTTLVVTDLGDGLDLPKDYIIRPTDIACGSGRLYVTQQGGGCIRGVRS